MEDPKLALFLRAETFRMENNFEDAIPAYEEILKLDPHDLGARKVLAELYLIYGDREKGVRAYYALSQEHRQRGEMDKVESFLKKIKILDASRTIDVTEKAAAELDALEASAGVAAEVASEEALRQGAGQTPARPRERTDLFENEGRPEVDLKAPLFGALPPDLVRKVVRALRVLHARKGTVLFREGDLTRSLFIIGSGQVEIRARTSMVGGDLGDARNVALLGPGEFFGEFSFLTGAPRSATARVASLDDAVLYILSREAIEHLSEEDALLLSELERYYRERALDLLFARSALFAGLPGPDRRRVASLFQIGSHPAGTVVIEEGRTGDDFFLIKSGEIQIVRKASDGRDILLALLGPNQFFGEISFLMGKPRTASAIATSDVELLSVDGKALQEIVSHYPSVKAQLEKARLRRAVETARRLSGKGDET